MTIPNGTRSLIGKLATVRSLALFVVFSGLGVATSIQYDHAQTVKEAFRELEHRAILAEAKVSGVLRGLDIGLRGLAADQDAEMHLTEKAITQHQLAFLTNFPEIRTVTATDSQGQVIAAQSIQTPGDLPAIRAFNVSGRDYFRFHRDAAPEDSDRMHLSRPFVGSSKRWIIVASRAIRSDTGEFRGAIVATVIPRIFESILRSAVSDDTVDAAAIHNRQGDILYRLPDPDVHTGKNIAQGSAFQHYLNAGTDITHHLGMTVTDGSKRLVVFSKIGDTGLDVAISARYEPVMAKWYRLAAAKIALYVLFMAGAMALFRQWQRRRQATLALGESEARFRHLFGHAPIALAISDKEGRVRLVNQAFEALFGYRQEEVPTVQAFRERVYPDAAQRQLQEQSWLDSWRETEGDIERTEPVEVSATGRDGSTKTILLSRQRLGDDMLVAFIDITARKMAEEKVRELSQAIEQSPEAIVITDLDARMQYVNDAFVTTSGYSRDELIGENPRLLRSGKTPRATFVALWSRLIQGQAWSGELINRRKNGEEYVEFAIISPMRDSSGRITHYVAIKQDVTEKKRLGEELDRHRYRLQELVDERTKELEIAKTKAEAANVAKSAFLANMSHEIRTPMNGVLGMAHLLRRSGVNDKQAGYLDKIEASGRHLIAVINDILDISKIEAGKLQIDNTEFSLPDLIQGIIDMIGHSAVDKGLKLHIDTADAPQSLRGDRIRLRQALVNYLSNAVKFTEQGEITLRCRVIEESETDCLLQFEVEDSGIGVPPEDVERLFQSFEQADNSPTRKHGGTGLGLAIAKRIAEMMGGTAGVRSVLGQGSTFWLTARLGRSSPTEHANQ